MHWERNKPYIQFLLHKIAHELFDVLTEYKLEEPGRLV